MLVIEAAPGTTPVLEVEVKGEQAVPGDGDPDARSGYEGVTIVARFTNPGNDPRR